MWPPCTIAGRQFFDHLRQARKELARGFRPLSSACVPAYSQAQVATTTVRCDGFSRRSFFGTALASTLFLGSLYASAPVLAQSEAVVIDQSNFAFDNTLIDNAGDVSLGLTRFFRSDKY